MRSKSKAVYMGGLLGLFVILLASGCDLTDHEDEVDLPVLLGSWRITDVVVDGLSTKQRLDAQYRALVLTLREDGSGNEFFEVLGTTQRGDIALRQEGRFFIDSEDDEITLLPDNFRQLELNYQIAGPDRVDYAADDVDAEDVLRFLGLGLQGDIDALTFIASKTEGM